MNDKSAFRIAISVGMIGLALVAAWLEISGKSADLLWIGVFTLFYIIIQ